MDFLNNIRAREGITTDNDGNSKNWHAAYQHSISNHEYRPNTWVPDWDDITNKPPIVDNLANVAYTNVNNNFSVLQDITGGLSIAGTTVIDASRNISAANVVASGSVTIKGTLAIESSSPWMSYNYDSGIRAGYIGFGAGLDTDDPFILLNSHSDTIKIITSTSTNNNNVRIVGNNIEAEGTVTATNIGSHAGRDFWNGTQVAYDAITTKDANTVYYINE